MKPEPQVFFFMRRDYMSYGSRQVHGRICICLLWVWCIIWTWLLHWLYIPWTISTFITQRFDTPISSSGVTIAWLTCVSTVVLDSYRHPFTDFGLLPVGRWCDTGVHLVYKPDAFMLSYSLRSLWGLFRLRFKWLFVSALRIAFSFALRARFCLFSACCRNRHEWMTSSGCFFAADRTVPGRTGQKKGISRI
jgi:hypothetical protein